MTGPEDTTRGRAVRRRWAWAAGGLLAVLVGVVAGFPWLLGTGPARRLILDGANRRLAPGGLDVASFRFSWFGPTVLTGFTLRDHQGEPTISAATVTWDRDLSQIIWDRPRYGTATFPNGHVRLVRGAEGEINLVETLRPVLANDPNLEVTFKIPGGSLTVEAPELPGPFEAARADIDLQLPAGLAPVRLDTKLQSDEDKAVGGGMSVHAEFARRDDDPTFRAELTPERWPFHIERLGVTLSGHLTGAARVDREGPDLVLLSDLQVGDLNTASPILRGDRVHIDELALTIDLLQSGTGWKVRKFQAVSPILAAEARGTYPPSTESPIVVDARIGLPAVVRQLPNLLPLREDLDLASGEARLHVEVLPADEGESIRAEALVADVRGTAGDRLVELRDPVQFTARLLRARDTLTVQDLALTTPFLRLKASGGLDRGIDFSGSVELAGLQRQTSDIFDFGRLQIAGDGQLKGRYQRRSGRFDGHITIDLDRFRLAGTPLGSFVEPELHLEANTQGAASDLGLPRSWDKLTLSLKAPTLQADVAIAEDVRADVSLPIELAGTRGQVLAHARGRWRERRLELDVLDLSAAPLTPEAEALSMALSATLDMDKGSLTVKQRPDTEPSVRVVDEGIAVTSWGQRASAAEGGLSGDVATLERAIAGWTGNRPLGLEGRWKARTRARRDGDMFRIATRLDLPDLTAPLGKAVAERFDLPTSATAQLEYDVASDLLTIQNVKVWGDVATIEVAGSIEGPMGRRFADLNGTVVLNDDLLNAFLDERIEPEARVVLRPRPLRVRGALSGPSLAAIARGLDAEVGADVETLDIYGMKFGPMPLVMRARNGQVTIDPLRTSLNGGRVDLRPEIVFDEERGVLLAIGSGSGVRGAQINEEVSRRVLSYAVPVLYNATSVRGIVSARIDSAEFPLLPRGDAKTDVRGVVAFQQVSFLPGPLGRQVFGLVGLENATLLRLDQNVPFQVLGDRVYQPGMSVPLIKLATLDVSGSVGFDRSLDLDFNVPIVPDFLDRIPIAGDIVGGLKIKVPVRGTLSAPIVDKATFDAGMKGMGDGLERRSRAVGEGILDRLRNVIPFIPPPPRRDPPP